MKRFLSLFVCMIIIYTTLSVAGVEVSTQASVSILPSVWMYSESIVSENETDTVCDGDMIAEISLGTIADSGNVWSCFAIYKQDNTLVGCAVTSVAAPYTENIILTIRDFKTENNERYTARVYLWDDKLRPLCGGISLTEKTEAQNYVDFVVDVPEGRDIVVLQLSDTQIEDSTQVREGHTINNLQNEYWKPEYMDERCFNPCREVIENVNPDLILITGDIIYGMYDDAGTSLVALTEFMESFDIPWAPVFGNHDNESYKGADWQCDLFESAENCLFKQRTLTGNGNYSVGVSQGGELKRVFFMLDSNGCAAMSEQSFANGHSKKEVGFGQDQIDWYTEVAQNISEKESDMKYTFAFHIQPLIFKEAYKKYGFTNTDTMENPINIDSHPDKANGDFGHIGRNLKSPWDSDFTIYNGMKALGADSILVGHEHCNNSSVVYDGIRFQFGQKSSAYDRINFKTADGSIVGEAGYATWLGDQILGGTVMTLSEASGAINNAYVYYCQKALSDIDSAVSVNGMNFYTGELTVGTNIDVTAVEFNGVNAYKVEPSGRGKVYIDPSLVANKEEFTFSVFLPEETTNMGILNGSGEFAIRVKPNEKEPFIDGTTDGYIVFSSKASSENLKLVHGEWKTYTVDISTLGTDCTEFAFDIPQDNTIYLKDISAGNKIAVTGMQFAPGELSADSNMNVSTVEFNGVNAYRAEADGRAKIYIDPALAANKSVFKFSVYMPPETTYMGILNGSGEFAIRVKPDNLEPDIDGSTEGYIVFSSKASNEKLKLVHGEWRSYEIDISTLGTSCTEISFVIPDTNILYFKDISVE